MAGLINATIFANLSTSKVCDPVSAGSHCQEYSTSRGILVNQFAAAVVNATAETCPKYILLGAESSWRHQTRAALYALGLIYCFVGLATITNLFMQAMDRIVQQTRQVVRPNDDSGIEEVARVRIWNPVIADITLLALGTSAPQISLSIIDAVQRLGQKNGAGLGPGTIVGSAAFNLYPILAVCVLVPKAGSVKRIQNVGVWIVELVWSFWAYVWLAIILQVSSPNVVKPWEAVCTVLQFPLLMIHAYVQDKGWRALCQSIWPSEHVLWKPLSNSSPASFNGVLHDQSVKHSSVAVIHLEQRKPEWELVDLQYQPMPSAIEEIRNGNASNGHHQVSFFKKHQDTNGVSTNGSDSLESTSRDEIADSNRDDLLAVLRSNSRSYRHPSTWADVILLWKMQFYDVFVIKRPSNETGKEVPGTAAECSVHLVTFPWRLLFAFLPPPALLHGWLAFLGALAFITGISSLLIELANLFGCVTGVSEYTLALTVLATGTSWPDLIASKIAADNQPTADSAIANINASNCINVYVGIGIPWLLQVFYNMVQHEEFRVPSAGLGFSLMLFFVTFIACQLVVIARRYIVGGELGGARKWAWASSILFMSLWLIFVVLSCLRNYHAI